MSRVTEVGRPLPPVRQQWGDLGVGAVPVSATTTGVVVTASATPHTPGAWTELVASLSADVGFGYFLAGGIAANNVNTASIVSIAVGAAGSEVELFSFACGGTGTPPGVPVFIPRGSRVSARIQSLVVSKTATVYWLLYPPRLDSLPSSKLVTMGLDLGASLGTAFGTSSAWAQVTAATAQPFRGLAIVVSVATTGAASAFPLFRVGVGAAGSEVSVGEWYLQSSSTEALSTFASLPVPPVMRHIPAGSRLAVSNSTASGYFGATLIGIPYA